MYVGQLCAILFMDGTRIGILLVMILHEISIDIINYAKNTTRESLAWRLVFVCFDHALGGIFQFLQRLFVCVAVACNFGPVCVTQIARHVITVV